MSSALKAVLLGAAITIATPAIAQDAVGYWKGTLATPAGSLPVGVNIERAAGGELTGSMDSPSQQAFDIPLSDVEADDRTLFFRVPAVGGHYRAQWRAETSSWVGSWSQGATALPLTLSAGERPDRAAATDQSSWPGDWTVPGNEEIAALLERRIAQRPGTGMVVGVLDEGGARVIARGPSDAGMFDGNTVFEIGSMTKVFTALLLADLVEEGIVSLDDPVIKYLPEGATMPTRGGQQITLKNLAQHDSGLPRLPGNLNPEDAQNPYAGYTERQLLDFLATYELPRDIGSEFDYSNLGMGLLGFALGRAAGTDYEGLLRKRILDPLKMHDTAIALSPDQRARFATGRDEFNRPTSAWDLATLAGAGALRSTATDMLKFLQAVLDPQSPLGPAMRLSLSDPREAPGFRAGLGWRILSAPTGTILMHGGGTGGFRTHMALQPDMQRAIVVLANSAVEPSTKDISLYLLAGAPAAEAGPVPDVPQTVERGEPIELTAEQLDRFVGTWRLTPQVNIDITREGDQLFAAVTGQGALPIFPRTPLEFFWRTANAEIVWLEEDGRITSATFTQDGSSAPLTKIE